jgi:hypothetical protein
MGNFFGPQAVLKNLQALGATLIKNIIKNYYSFARIIGNDRLIIF